jgi:hypothetical protein
MALLGLLKDKPRYGSELEIIGLPSLVRRGTPYYVGGNLTGEKQVVEMVERVIGSEKVRSYNDATRSVSQEHRDVINALVFVDLYDAAATHLEITKGTLKGQEIYKIALMHGPNLVRKIEVLPVKTDSGVAQLPESPQKA